MLKQLGDGGFEQLSPTRKADLLGWFAARSGNKQPWFRLEKE